MAERQYVGPTGTTLEETTMKQTEAQRAQGRFRPALRGIVAVVVVVGVTSLVGVFVFYAARDMAQAAPWMMEAVRDHFAALVGLPAAALAALCLVLVLEVKSGPIEFEGFGFKFRGASGEVILWVICFLAIATAIKLLW
jgi:uncharacterized membrane protein